MRGAYLRMVESNEWRRAMFQLLEQNGQSAMADKLLIDEVVLQIRQAVHKRHSAVEMTIIQDEPDDAKVRLNEDEMQALLDLPDLNTLKGLRDAAMIALMLTTGVRVGELVKLGIDDISREFNGKPALLIRHGKGNKQRMVPYGENEWVIQLVRTWLVNAGITRGPVFRAVSKGGTVSDKPITIRAVQLMMEQYPTKVRGTQRVVPPHSLRRTYARWLWENGVAIEVIRQNLGHARIEQTLAYVGVLDSTRASAPGICPAFAERFQR